ncbi:MAG: hypothetical protein IPL20_17865 [Saprospiraceae bacterium]|nr:hypothetical protein [Saprospiraceae bacterium]
MENGRIEASEEVITSQLKAVINSVTNSIFTSNPLIHLHEIEGTKSSIDSIVRLQLYKPTSEKKKTHFLNLPKYFRISADTSSVVMSRYLTRNEISFIIKKAKEEVKKFQKTKNM